MELWEQLKLEILSETEKIKASLKGDNNSMHLIEVVRAIDHVFIVTSFFSKKSELDWNSLFQFQTKGYPNMIDILLDQQNESQTGFPLFATFSAIQNWTHTSLIKSGHIAYLDHFLELSRSGIVAFEKTSPTQIRIQIPLENAGFESIETMDMNWLQQKHIEESEEIPDGTKIIEELDRCVRFWKKDFIAYDSSPILDEYYKKYGVWYSQQLFGTDDFQDTSLFGNISYGNYKQVLTAIIGWSLKHRDSCWRLQRKAEYKINPWNIYSLPMLKSDLVDDLSSWLDKSPDIISEIINTITLTSKNKSIFTENPGAPPPFIFQISKTHILRSLAGTLSNPFFALNRILKETFPKDYSKAVNHREELFRNELYSLFNAESILKCMKPPVLKDNHKHSTDIDAMLYDTNNKTLIIVQLKWMESFGTNMKERYTRGKNFSERASAWVKSVTEWIDSNNVESLLKYFYSSPKDEQIKNVHFLVIGRYYSFFTGAEYDSRAEWVSWYQIKRYYLESEGITKSLDSFIDYIRKNSTHLRSHPSVVKDMKIKVGKYDIILTHK